MAFLTVLFAAGALFAIKASASETNGTIGADTKFAWGENIGWVNFAAAESNVHISDSALTGKLWTATYGWINLSPARSGVKNDAEGNLSGQAWAEGLGWINFAGVKINSSGVFTGEANGTIAGRITFDCARCGVTTDWRPASVRGGGEDDQGEETIRTIGGGGSSHSILPTTTQATSTLIYPIVTPLETALRRSELIKKIERALAIILPDFIQIRLYEGQELALPLRDLLPRKTPLALGRPWRLLSPQAERFALQPLPGETRLLAAKFPQLAQTLNKVGISRMADVGRLQEARFALPGFSKLLGLNRVKIEPGRFEITVGVPTAKLSLADKARLPAEIIFARSFSERLDLKMNLTFNDNGRPVQQVSTIVGKTLNLVVKPEHPVNKVTGYIVLSKRQNAKSALKISLNSLAAAAIFSSPDLAAVKVSAPPEKKFVLTEFEYTDPDRDGIYTANVPAPLVAGEYEVITVMDYLNPELGAKEIRLIAVVDPEGYVFTKSGKYEARISAATVSLYWLNPLSKQYELWPAKEYLQENPQVTDPRGTYSFLVPEGSYYLLVQAEGFGEYRGEGFTVIEGNGVHTNIELKPKSGWRAIDWKLFLIVGAALGVGYEYAKRRRARNMAL